MHWIGARTERLAFTASIWRMTGALSINNVRGNSQHRLRVNRIAISRMLPQFAHEHRNYSSRELIDTVVVIAEHRELAFGLIIDHQSGVIANDFYLRAANRRQAIGYHRETGDAAGHSAHPRVIPQR